MTLVYTRRILVNSYFLQVILLLFFYIHLTQLSWPAAHYCNSNNYIKCRLGNE